MSRTTNSIKMVLASTICQIAVMVCGFILPPLLISHFGSEVNGLLNTVKQMMAYFGVVCLGLGSAAQVALYKPIAEDNWKEINSILAATKHFFNRSGIVFAVLVLVSSILFPFLFVSGISNWDVFLIILITGLGSISEYIIVAKYKVFLAADQRNYVNSKITTEGILLNTLISVLLIYADCSVILIQVGATLVYIVRLLLTIRYVNKQYPKLSFDAEDRNDASLNQRWNAFSYQLSGLIISLSPAIIIGILCSLSEVSVYSIYFMVFSSLMMIAGIFSAGLSAPFGDLIVRNEKKILHDAFRCYEFVYTTIMFVCFTCSASLMMPFIKAYIHNTDGVVYALPLFSMLMCFYFVARSLRTPFMTIIEARGLFKENYKANLIEALSYIIVSILFVKWWGLLGIALAGIVTALPRSLKYLYDGYETLGAGKDCIFFLLKIMLNIALGVGLYYIPWNIEADNLVIFIVNAIPAAIVILLTTIVVNIIIDMRTAKSLLSKLKNIIKL